MTLSLPTQQKRQVLDITAHLEARIPHGFASGVIVVVALHTTAAVTTADLDPGTDLDFLDALAALLPDLHWRHPHNPAHAPDHLLASLIGPSVIIPIEEGGLMLGTWQRVILVELDGPRDRQLSLQFLPAQPQ